MNAAHRKNVPERKTDQKDAEWIADLLRHGLLKAGFIPDRPHQELRDLLVYRQKMVQTRAAEVNRIQKVFEAANVKIGSILLDITGNLSFSFFFSQN